METQEVVPVLTGLLTVDQIAGELQVSRATIFRWLSTEDLPAHRLSARVLRFDRDEVLAWVRSRCFSQQEPAA